LTFTIDNSASALSAAGLEFADNLPGGVVTASPANAFATCSVGTVTIASPGDAIFYTGGSVGAAVSCTAAPIDPRTTRALRFSTRFFSNNKPSSRPGKRLKRQMARHMKQHRKYAKMARHHRATCVI
jgi:hypothetical protein